MVQLFDTRFLGPFIRLGVAAGVVLALLLSVQSCREPMVCYTFQSMYLIDSTTNAQFFSEFDYQGDSVVPKERHYVVERDHRGAIKWKSYRQKQRDWEQIPLVTVYPMPKPDTTQYSVPLDSAAVGQDEPEQGYE